MKKKAAPKAPKRAEDFTPLWETMTAGQLKELVAKGRQELAAKKKKPGRKRP
jgi:hypothetical protein